MCPRAGVGVHGNDKLPAWPSPGVSVTHDVSHLGSNQSVRMAALFPRQAVAFSPPAISEFTAIVLYFFLNVARIYIGKKCLFFFLFSVPWEMSSSRNVPKSRSWPRGGWAPAALWGPPCPMLMAAPSLAVGQKPGEGEAARGAAPTANTLGFVSSSLRFSQLQLWTELRDVLEVPALWPVII